MLLCCCGFEAIVSPLLESCTVPQTHARDPLTGRQVRLFNPRQQEWSEHFAWSEDGTEIEGLTLCGRATVVALKLNNSEIIVARRLWVSVGWWPPED